MFERRELPFTHWVDDGFLLPHEVDAVAAEFPPPGGAWHTFSGAHENGKGQRDTGFGPATQALVDRLTAEPFCAFLDALTDIGPLKPDLLGGGMHQTVAGGHLDVHVDFNTHPRMPGMRRALNLLVYLNPGWQPGHGGELELWDGVEDHAAALVEPIGGRAVLFPTSATSWHGHPNPVAAGQVRRSVAIYYFTPGEVDRAHSTEWLDAR